ncbi:MAG: diphosphomevalonate decarboxylase [Candidatus Marinimicrobia bacterium]|nr:diphosphomevalonate decarboxylase [Candidatus Neomarinimicrobiota bacterium]MCF7880562.1 diphosphomevalonate decarboxylase [Candidatus Neomarinimicrobiota bacterium]
MQATAKAHPNIALIKYWGKRNAELNLPATGSISMTLDALWTETTARFDKTFDQDILILDGTQATQNATSRVSQFLDIFRSLSGTDQFARVESVNNFPTAAGLASSASGFAALALAASTSLGLDLAPTKLSELARRGSGSAARSIYGGFVEMSPGEKSDGADAFATQLYAESFWDVRLLVLIMSDASKQVSSTDGMNRTMATSPYYSAWKSTIPTDLDEMRVALKRKDIHRVGELAEHSCLKMHASSMASRPGIIYWNKGTVEAMNKVRELRNDGIPAYFTIDAGPQVKVLCLPEDEEKLTTHFQQLPGVEKVITASPGPGVSIVGESP